MGRGRRVASSLSEINVVPLVDVMLVLLIIFMITAPMIQRGIDVNLPVAARASRIEGDRVVVTITSAYRQNRTVFLNDEQIRVDALQERVRQKMETVTSKQVYLRGDGTLYYQELMDVFDRLKGAGVEKVGLETKAPGER
jgi:biopolymer transport protein TolR